jgi:hypothetical protein
MRVKLFYFDFTSFIFTSICMVNGIERSKGGNPGKLG